MDIRKLQRAIVDGLEDVKAQHIAVFNTEHLSPLFERVIVASGTSNRQTKALASSVRDAVKSRGMQVLRTEGEENGEWIIVDCGAAVCHVMQPAIREYYRLEEIWGEKAVKMKAAAVKKGLPKAEAVPISEARPGVAKKGKSATSAKAKAIEAAEQMTEQMAGLMADKAAEKPARKASGKAVSQATRKASSKAPSKAPSKVSSKAPVRSASAAPRGAAGKTSPASAKPRRDSPKEEVVAQTVVVPAPRKAAGGTGARAGTASRGGSPKAPAGKAAPAPRKPVGKTTSTRGTGRAAPVATTRKAAPAKSPTAKAPAAKSGARAARGAAKR